MKPLKCNSCGANLDSEQLDSRGTIACKYCGTLYFVERRGRHHQIVRRRGTAIVEYSKGILVIAGKGGIYLLPGGGAKRNETREKATIRELKEETGLKAKSVRYLFTYHDPPNRKIRNLHKVFLVEADGSPKRTSHESRYIGYWTPESSLPISKTTRFLIEKYLAMRPSIIV